MLLGLVCLWHVISVSMTMDLHFALSLCGCFPPAQVSSFVYSTHNTLLLTQLYNDYVHSGWAQGRANNTVDLSLKAAPVLLLISQDFLLIFDFFFFFFLTPPAHMKNKVLKKRQWRQCECGLPYILNLLCFAFLSSSDFPFGPPFPCAWAKWEGKWAESVCWSVSNEEGVTQPFKAVMLKEEWCRCGSNSELIIDQIVIRVRLSWCQHVAGKIPVIHRVKDVECMLYFCFHGAST